MRSKVWSRGLMALALPFALAACGGETEPAEDTTPLEQPTTQTPVPATGGTATGGTAVEPAADLPAGVTAAMVQEGQQLFGTVCAACHGPQGTGTALGPDLTDDEWLNISGRDYDEILQNIQTGVPQPVEHPAPMPPLGGGNFDEEQVRALAAYVFSISA